METKTIVEAIIIVIVIIFLVLIPMKGWPIVKTLLNMGEDTTPQVTPDSVKQEYQNIMNSYEECFNSNKDNCFCNINILAFPKFYNLAYYGKNTINLEKIGQPVINSKIFSGKNVNCYIISNAKNNLEIKNPSSNHATYLPLDQVPKRIIKQNYGKTEPSDNNYKLSSDYDSLYSTTQDYGTYVFWNDQKLFYKQGNNICFVLMSTLSDDARLSLRTVPIC